MKMSTLSGEQLAQVNNPDPFAPPVWRSPVLHTPGWIIAAVQIGRTVKALVKFAARHPAGDAIVAALAGAWYLAGWPGAVILGLVVAGGLIFWWRRWPMSFARFVSRPAVGKWRRWHYHRHWAAVMTLSRLAPVYRGRLLVPVLGKVASTRYTDQVAVRLVSGQCPADFADRAENLAHGFGALLCRIRTGRPGWLILDMVRRDALATAIPALPIAVHVNLKALPVGVREDGS
jgi:DNA segregation ATPase FtsK/SpoIIIE, S-DNA-T family